MSSQWISVEERLPTFGDEVLVYWAEGYYEVSHCFKMDYGKGWSWSEPDDNIPRGEVTHWMPLPVPPNYGPGEPAKLHELQRRMPSL